MVPVKAEIEILNIYFFIELIYLLVQEFIALDRLFDKNYNGIYSATIFLENDFKIKFSVLSGYPDNTCLISIYLIKITSDNLKFDYTIFYDICYDNIFFVKPHFNLEYKFNKSEFIDEFNESNEYYRISNLIKLKNYDDIFNIMKLNLINYIKTDKLYSFNRFNNFEKIEIDNEKVLNKKLIIKNYESDYYVDEDLEDEYVNNRLRHTKLIGKQNINKILLLYEIYLKKFEKILKKGGKTNLVGEMAMP